MFVVRPWYHIFHFWIFHIFDLRFVTLLVIDEGLRIYYARVGENRDHNRNSNKRTYQALDVPSLCMVADVA